MPARRLAAALVAAAALAAGCSSGGRATSGQAATTAPPPGTSAGGATSTTAAAATSSSAAPAARHTFPLRGCRFCYSHGHHDYPATDIFAPSGCTVVAPVSGTVDEVSARDRWSSGSNRGADRGGLSVSLVGADGVRYYGSHLSSIATGVVRGARVDVGRPLGRVGNSGDAAGVPSHLHFGLSWPTGPGVWWIRRGVVDPWPFLTSWRKGGNLSPAAAVRAARARAGGTTPPCSVNC
jgi:murein DD-endopeptidase MepM/ murein hydrolase activator NlpD